MPRFGSREMDEWRSRGWTLVRGFLGEARLTDCRRECARLNEQPSLFEQRGAVVASPRRRDRLDPVIDVAPQFRALSASRELLGLVCEALGGEAQLLKDKYVAKPPGTDGYALHVDAAYWLGMGFDLDRCVSAMIFFDDASHANGAIECADGWHPIGSADEPIVDPPEDSVGPLTLVEARAGDVLLLHARTAHRSGVNRSGGPRRVLQLTYAIDARPGLYDRYQTHRRGLT